MTEPTTAREGGRRVPTAIVLAVASAMVSVGVAAWMISRPEDGVEADERVRPDVRVDQQSPELAAESFLDAWRKRRFDVARALSRGAARAAVEERAAADEGYPQELRGIEKAWDLLADSRLRYAPSRSDTLPGGRMQLTGIAEGEFAGRPYRREIGFVCAREGTRWLVEEMHLGDVLEGPGFRQDAGT